MRAVLLAINAKYVHSALSVWVVAAGVSEFARFHHDVGVIECTIHQCDEDIVNQVAESGPDVLGISTYIWNAEKLPGLLQALRKRLPETVFVLGGPEAEHNVEYWRGQGANHVLPGAGEYGFPALLDMLEEERDEKQREAASPADCGCGTQLKNKDCFRCSALLTRTMQAQPAAEEPVDPYSEAYLETLKGRLAYLETSRGCPFECQFCLSAGEGVSFFPLDTVKKQIDKLSKTGVRTIKLVDRTFNCNAERAYGLFEYIIGLSTGCRFHFEVAADMFDDRTIELLSTAQPGRIQLEAGLQSFFEPALKSVSRNMDIEKAQRSIKALLREKNIHIHVDLIAGLPFETFDDFQNSFDRAYMIGAHTIQLGFLKLLHGSVLRERAEALGLRYSTAPPYRIQSSPWLSPEDISALMQAENALNHTFNKCRFLSALEYVLSASGMRPFSLFHQLGGAVSNRGTQLETYAGQIFEFFAGLPGIDVSILRDKMVCDWLSMVKGKNMPAELKRETRPNREDIDRAEKLMGRKPGRGETAVLSCGSVVFVDKESHDPVTGLYRLRFFSSGMELFMKQYV